MVLKYLVLSSFLLNVIYTEVETIELDNITAEAETLELDNITAKAELDIDNITTEAESFEPDNTTTDAETLELDNITAEAETLAIIDINTENETLETETENYEETDDEGEPILFDLTNLTTVNDYDYLESQYNGSDSSPYPFSPLTPLVPPTGNASDWERPEASIMKTNDTESLRCETAAECKSNQVCYLPTNECKDQLIFKLAQRSSCTTSADCLANEVCYLQTKTCVCDLNSVEVGGACKLIKQQSCTKPSKQYSSDGWSVSPYCTASNEHPQHGTLALGDYTEGTGTPADQMLFTGGSDFHCDGSLRGASLEYVCYCEDFECTESTTIKADAAELFTTEPMSCQYQFYVFTPLACSDRVA